MINRYQTLWLGGGPKVSIPVSQYDSMWRFRFSLIENSTPWTIPADAIAGMNGRKPDGNTFSFPADIENNTIVVDSDTQMTAVAGVTLCEVYVISGGKKVATVNFDLVVEEAPKAQGDISSDTTLPAYAEILDRIAEMEVEGVPPGGRAGEVLAKASNDDYDVEWITVEGGGGGSSGVAFVTYNTATSADIEAAYQDGLAVFCVSGNYIYPLTKRVSATNHEFSGYSAEGFIIISCVASSWVKQEEDYSPPLAAIRAPLPLAAVAAVGSHNLYAREDHVHPLPSKSDLGLGNVDNTSDLSKPISTATQTALDGKANTPTEYNISTAGAVSQELTAGDVYHFTGALTSLTITFAQAQDLPHYHFDFLSGSTAPTLTLPSSVVMPDSFAVEANKRYEVDILNNYGAVMAWENS